MRKEPSHRSEIVSQLLFGEYVETGDSKEDFVAVSCLFDGYEGWVQASQLTPVAADEVLQPVGYISSFTGEVMIDGQSRKAPFGAPVYGCQNVPLSLGGRTVLSILPPAGVWPSGGREFTPNAAQPVFDLFLHAPYLWGGKSVFGTDCSGFVQQVFKLFGCRLLRDAYLQAGQGRPVERFDQAMFGDLLFFQNEKGRVTHVGLLLPGRQIIHASGRVRIDTADSEGIINAETGERTHRLHSIRRFF